MTDENDARLTRQLIREELDASNSYEEKAQATSDPEAAKVYRDISREEKVHAGELQALLDREDPESTEAMKEGMEETGLEGSFKDIFDRKREDYIHKSVYGTHVEKKGDRGARNRQYLRTQLNAERDANNNVVETGDGATPEAGGTTLLNLLSPELKEQFDQIIFDALPDREKRAREYGAKRIKQIESTPFTGGSHQKLLNSYFRAEEPLHIYRPRGKMRIREDELDKFNENGPKRRDEKVFSDVESGQDIDDTLKLGEIAQNQGAGEQADGSDKRISTSEFERQGKPVGLRNDTQHNLSWGNDYDEIFDPDQIGETEVERFVNGQIGEEDADAPSSDKRPWLTWRYFGNHLLQATTIRDEAKDWAGNAQVHYVRVPNRDGTFDTKGIYTSRIVMNYRISRPGKDINYEGEPFKMICTWDPTAFNPITRRDTGAFIPEKVMTPGGTVIYDKNDVTRFQDPWDALEAEMSKQALYDGVVEYLSNPEFRAKVDKFSPTGAQIGDTQHLDEVRDMIMNTDESELGAGTGAERMMQARLRLNSMDPDDWNQAIAKVSMLYKDLDEEFTKAKEEAARNKSQLDAMIDGVVSDSVARHLNDWLKRNNVMGFDDNETITSENMYRHYDSISGMFRFRIRGEKVEWPLEKMEAWMEHAEKYYDRQARYEYNEALAEEQRIQDAFDKRENIENAAIADYLYKSMVAEMNARGEGRLDDLGHAALHSEANRLTQEMLYGDGTVFNEFLKNMGSLDEDVGDPRSFLLKKAGFDWDVFEYNRKLVEKSADLALAAEVSSMKDPRFHETVKMDLEKAFIKRKNGIMGAFAIAQANRAMAKERTTDPEWAWENSIQSFLNRKTPGGRRTLYGENGVMTARFQDILDEGTDTTETLNNLIQGQDPEAVLGEQAPLAIDRAIENVTKAIENPAFKESLNERKFQKENGPKATNALFQAISDPEKLKQEILSGSEEGSFLLRTLMNINGKARALGYYSKMGLTGKEGKGINLKRARRDLGRMFNSALVPGGSRDQFATGMRNLARREVESILENGSDDPALKGEGEEAVFRAYEKTMNKLVSDAALRSAQLNIEKIHKIARPRKPKLDDPEYDRKMDIYEKEKNAYYFEVRERTEEIYAERDRLLNDPEYVQSTKEAMETLAKRTTINTLVADRKLRQAFTMAMGNSDRMMGMTGFLTMGEDLMWESDKERTSLDNMPELSDDEKLEKRIAPFRQEGRSDFEALVESYKAQGYPQRQAEERARQFAEGYDESVIDVPERGTAEALLGEYQADDISLPDQLSEDDSLKIVRDALMDYFVDNYYKTKRVTPEDVAKLKAGGKDMMMVVYKYLSGDNQTKDLVKELKQDPANPDMVTGYMINRNAFSGRDFDVNFKDLNSKKPENRMDEMGGARRTVQENARGAAHKLLADYFARKGSPGLVQRLYPRYQASSRARGMERYDAAIDKILRNKLVEKRAMQLRMQGRNPHKVNRMAKRQVLDDFDMRITSKDLSEQGTPFAQLLEEYGMTPNDIKGVKVEAMRTSGAPYYERFIKPFFERSGRKVGADTADDELKLFEQLNSDDPEAQNHPEFKEYWQKFMDSPDALNPDQIGQLISGIEFRTKRRGDKIDAAQRAQKEEMNKFYGDQANEYRSKNLILSALLKVARAKSGDGSPGGGLRNDMYNGIVPTDTDLFRFYLSDAIRDEYERGRLPLVSDPVAFEKVLFARIVNDPDNKINFTGLEDIQSSVRDKARKEREAAEERATKDAELKGLQARFGPETGEQFYLRNHLQETLADEEKILEDRQETYKEEDEENAERLKTQGGPKKDKPKIQPLKRAPVADVSDVSASAVEIGAKAAPGTPQKKMTELPVSELGSKVQSPTADYQDALGKVESMNSGQGGGRVTRDDVEETNYTVTDDAKEKYKSDMVLANADLAKENTAKSAFDTPFADILSSKRSQTIRKNETGTVISTDTVSAPMTEQADAPQEQNSVEAGGFAELMKSKMASTHMMEEPSEEREDWIPMRNGYRRVTIGSGKDCVRNMMRNPPRSANAPGTRTRKV